MSRSEPVSHNQIQLELKSKNNNMGNNRINPDDDFGEVVGTRGCSACSVISARNKWYRWWQVIVTFSIVCSFCLDTFLAAFDSTFVELWVAVYIADAIFMVDVVLRFFVPYMNESGIIIKERSMIKRRYTRGSNGYVGAFVIDLLTILPLDLLALVWPLNSSWRGLTLSRLNRVIRIYRLAGFFEAREAELGANTLVLRCLKYLMVSVISTHGITCVWYTLGCSGQHTDQIPTCGVESWANLQLTENSTTGDRYILSLYWAVATATSTGYGDIHALTEGEMWFSVVAMLVGIAVFFGMLLGGLTSMLTNLDQQRARYVHRLNTIKDHVNEYEVATDLKQQVIGYYEYLWSRKKGVLSEGIYGELPLTFQAEICHCTNSGILEKAPIFEGLGEGFLRMLSLNIKPMLYLPTQIIITRGDVGHQMFFIHRGEVEVMSEEDDETPIAKLKSGKLFGEVSLLCSLPRTATIRASTHCDLMVLEKTDLNAMLIHYPEIADRLHEQARQRVKIADKALALENKKPQANVTAGYKAFQPRKVGYVKPSRFRERRQSFAPSAISGSRIGSLSRVSQSHRPSISSLGSITRRRSSMAISEEVEVLKTDGFVTPIRRESIAERTVDRLTQMKTWFEDHTLDPDGRILSVWQTFIMCCTVVVAFGYPYMACFTASKNREGYFDSEGGHAFLGISYILDVLFMVDIIITLRTNVDTPHGQLSDFASISKVYCKSASFWLDLASVLPLEIFCLAASTSTSRGRMFAFLRLNRCLKFFKLPLRFSQLERTLDISLVKLRVFGFLIYITLLSHLVACLLHVVACNDDKCSADSWIGIWAGPGVDLTPLREYIVSLYWAAATMTSTGYGDLTAYSLMGRFVALSAMLMGLLLYGLSLAVMAATLANLENPKVVFQEKVFAVKQFMEGRHLGAHLQLRVMNYLRMMWSKNRGCWMPGQRPLMYDMPQALQTDIAMDDAGKLLGQVPLFMNTDVSFLRLLALRTQNYMFSPGDIVIYAGDVGKEMYCIRRGYCEILSPDLSITLAEIGPGQYFGEIGMFYGEYRTATVRTITHCEVIRLQLGDMNKVVDDFPLLREQFMFARENRALLERLQTAARARLTMDHEGSVSSFMDVIKDANRKIQNLHKNVKGKEAKPSQKIFKSQPTAIGDSAENQYEAPFKKLNTIQKIFSKLLLRRVLLQQGSFLKWWTFLIVVLALIQAFTLPLQAAFLHTSKTIWFFNYMFDLFAYMNMYIGLHTAFYNENRVLVTHPLSTAKHYLSRGFLIELISCFPIEVFAYAASPHFTDEDLQIYALVRLNRILQIYRLPLAFSFKESDVETRTGGTKGVKYMFYILIFLHWLTCGLFILGCPPSSGDNKITTSTGHTCSKGAWIMQFDSTYDIKTTSVPVLYIISLYWASATSVSVGYGDISAYTNLEMVILLCFMIIGVLFFGYIIASVAASLANADAQRARFKEKLDAVSRYLGDQKLDEVLKTRVLSYYEYVWMRTRGVEPVSLFDGLPLSLWGDVTLSLYQDIISNISLFKDTEVSFIKMLSTGIRPLLFLKGEYIVKKHDIGSEMYFIHRGAVDVVSEDGHIVFDTMKPGQSFGEVALLFSCPRTASVRARTNADVFMLTKQDLDLALEYYPAIKEKIMSIGEERRNQARKRSAANAQVVVPPTRHAKSQAESIAETMAESIAAMSICESAIGEEDEDEENAPSVAVCETPVIMVNDAPEVTLTDAPETTVSDTQAAESPVVEVEICASCEENMNQNNADDPKPEAEPEPARSSLLSRIRKANRFVLGPSDELMYWFSMTNVIVSLASGWLILYQVAYQDHNAVILALNYICDFVSLVEIYVKFHKSFHDDFGDLIEDFDVVFSNYLRQPFAFPLDAVAACPLEVFAFAMPEGKKMLGLSYLRLIHLIRLLRTFEYFSKWEKELNINVLLVRLCKSFASLALMIHLFSCIWYIVSCPLGECTTDGWVSGHTAGAGFARPILSYCTCVYWCVATMTSTGYGDVSAHLTVEMLFASFVMIVGKLMFGFVLGSIASTLSNAESRRVQYDHKLHALECHMKDQDVPKDLQHRVSNYYNYLWNRNKGVEVKTLFRDAPICLFAEISLNVSRSLLTTVPLFAAADESFLRHLAQKVNQMLCMPGDYIVRKGDVGQEVFFIQHGEVEVLSGNDNSKVNQVLAEGNIFGEVSLVCSLPRRVTVRASTHVDLLTLSRMDMEEVLTHYPTLAAQIEHIAEVRFGHIFEEMRR